MTFHDYDRELLLPRASFACCNPPASAPVTAESDKDKSNLGASAFGAKTIGLWGGVMLLINNVAGPTVASMPALAQQAGWLAMILVMTVVATLSALCGVLLISAIRRMPGNDDFEQRVEFSDMIRFYFPRPLSDCVMATYHAYLILTLMTYIIQSAQVIDYIILDRFGCAPGIEFQKHVGPICGIDKDSVTPFGKASVLPLSMFLVALACSPFAALNLDDNVCLQWVAIIGLSGMAIIWTQFLVVQPAFPQPVPVVTASQRNLVGTILFNFAFMSALPSWVNEKRPDVSVGTSFALSLGYVVVVYSAIGILGGSAFHPFYTTDQNLFSKIYASGSQLAKSTVAVYPILQNFTTIPVLAILIRYNLQTSGLPWKTATAIACALPWVLSVPFYSGQGFNTIATIGGLVTSSVINFIAPTIAFLRSPHAPAKTNTGSAELEVRQMERAESAERQ